ncbi:MAG: ribonuclease HI [Dehalococcoidales bacterium]|nr:ribonuclease HI [Dehalococcoidales bacterium]
MEEKSKINSVKDTAYLSYSGNKISITTPYHAGFVVQLKAGTTSRRWNPEKKTWSVDVKEREKLLEITGQFFQIAEECETPKSISSAAAVALPKAESSDIASLLKPGAELEIWTDGACSVNPGPGGYGILFKYQGRVWEKSGGFRLTTNNRMELMGVIVALETLPSNSKVKLFSDSQYLVNSITKGWTEGWRARGWIKKGGHAVPNADLWKRLLDLCGRHEIDIQWVKGHNGSPENERCDEMAVAEAGKRNLPEDKGYQPEA